MPMLKQRRLIAAKIETVEGTAETLAAADSFLVYDPAITPDIQAHERNPSRITLSPLARVIGARSVSLSFSVELKGSGTAGTAPEYGDLFRACGMSETIVAVTSVTYAPASASIPSLTFAVYGDMNTSSVRYLVAGCRGTYKIEHKVGEPVRIMFDFKGQVVGTLTSDQTMLTGATYDATIPMPFLSTALTLHGDTLRVASLTVDIANTVYLRQDVTTSSGYISAALVTRNPIGNIDPEMELVATHDFYGKWLNGTQGILTYTLGATAGNIVTFNAAKTQYTNVAESDRDGFMVNGIDFSMNMTAGDDEFSLIFT